MKRFLLMGLMFWMSITAMVAAPPQVINPQHDDGSGGYEFVQQTNDDCTMSALVFDFQMVGIAGEYIIMEPELPRYGRVIYPPYEVVYTIVDLTGTSNPPGTYNRNHAG